MTTGVFRGEIYMTLSDSANPKITGWTVVQALC